MKKYTLEQINSMTDAELADKIEAGPARDVLRYGNEAAMFYLLIEIEDEEVEEIYAETEADFEGEWDNSVPEKHEKELVEKIRDIVTGHLNR